LKKGAFFQLPEGGQYGKNFFNDRAGVPGYDKGVSAPCQLAVFFIPADVSGDLKDCGSLRTALS